MGQNVKFFSLKEFENQQWSFLPDSISANLEDILPFFNHSFPRGLTKIWQKICYMNMFHPYYGYITYIVQFTISAHSRVTIHVSANLHFVPKTNFNILQHWFLKKFAKWTVEISICFRKQVVEFYFTSYKFIFWLLKVNLNYIFN